MLTATTVEPSSGAEPSTCTPKAGGPIPLQTSQRPHRLFIDVGAPVTTIDAGPTTAARAAAALGQVGLTDQVRVVHGDGYLGDPDGGRWDRIIVTCGTAGIPAGWLSQLTPDGLITAPVALGSHHPIVIARPENTGVSGQTMCWADFMYAAGALRPPELCAHPPTVPITWTPLQRHPSVVARTEPLAYQDLRTYLGAHDPRTARTYHLDDSFVAGAGATALIGEGAAAWVQMSGDLLTAGPADLTAALANRLTTLAQEWLRDGWPPTTGWATQFTGSLAPRGTADPEPVVQSNRHHRSRATAAHAMGSRS